MKMWTKKQMEYIDSVDGKAHMSAVEIIGKLEEENAQAKEALEKCREYFTTIFKQYKSGQHVICNDAADIIDKAVGRKVE